MACSYDDSSISIVSSYKMSEQRINGKDVMEIVEPCFKIHTKNEKKSCLNELSDILYITITHHDGSSQILKLQLQRGYKAHSHSHCGSKGRLCSSTCLITSMPSNDSNPDDEKLRDCHSLIERE